MEWQTTTGEKINTIEDMPKGVIGFIYVIEYNDGSLYLGKKNLYSTRLLPELKTKMREGEVKKVRKRKGGHLITYDEVTTESDWKTYKGSPKYTGNRIPVQKTILSYARTTLELTYLENRELFSHRVLEKDYYLNENIGGKFYKGRFYNLIED